MRVPPTRRSVICTVVLSSFLVAGLEVPFHAGAMLFNLIHQRDSGPWRSSSMQVTVIVIALPGCSVAESVFSERG